MLPWQGGFALVIASNERCLKLASPKHGMVTLDPDDLAEQFPDGIELLLMEQSNATPDQKFGPGWFWPALKRYRGVLIQVLAASFVVQLFTLANPLLIQVIIDKVISQRSLDTLQVLGIALVVVTILEGVLGSLKTFLFAETTNRIDQRLGAEVIDHLLRLPLGYFDRRPVGELGTRVAELEDPQFPHRSGPHHHPGCRVFRDLHRGDGGLQLAAHLDCSFRSADSDRFNDLGGPLFRRRSALLPKKTPRRRAILWRCSPAYRR